MKKLGYTERMKTHEKLTMIKVISVMKMIVKSKK